MSITWTEQQTTTKIRPPSSRRDSEEANIRRSYNRLMRNSQVQITAENQEFLSPEYLDYQKKTIMTEIKKLKEEIKPLNKQYSELLAQKEHLQPESDADTSGFTTEYVAKISEEQKRYTQLETELAKTRRFFSEATKLRLQYESRSYLEEIKNFNELIQNNQNAINAKQKQISSITESQLADTIREQDSKINELSIFLNQLHQEERTLKEKMLEYLDNAAASSDNAKIEMLRKKLADLKTKKMRLNAEYRRQETDVMIQKDTLISQIENKKRKKQEQNYTRNWKKKLNIKEIVVTEDDYPEPSELPPLYNNQN
ncbi:hypothetical protein TVAG_463820 [Trichomonas vaginalis G3]|uniref:Uncharacterized protein n=1 Tax=Trichomonas vaginalis (strain ATCC PRA-98 / G3) TaxID=412133 RepID=A2E234_TRIV3|nr:hypothetical protein TVAGG3_1049030 [Trichomonas vaginalis G3]EAY13248.1 hypothetical protein TVAG_463820 [Trichomonas vaginalis G3]KAI5494093.1 hypothetical protein TVAGG3_1049030 [Trichomonas vaginalis G3]|eukprot:XP_001325471.1 hypothetical protein [Trichomonas vaginalis G3]